MKWILLKRDGNNCKVRVDEISTEIIKTKRPGRIQVTEYTVWCRFQNRRVSTGMNGTLVG